MKSFKCIPGFSHFLGKPTLSGTSEWLLQDYILLYAHLYSIYCNFKEYFTLICRYSPKVL